MATLTLPQTIPSPVEDAQSLRKACQGLGTDEKAIIEVVAHRSGPHRSQIRRAYLELYKEDLVKRLESELSGDFEKAIYRWILEPVEREVMIANMAVNAKMDFRTIIETVCINSPDEVLALKQAYQSRFKHSFEERVASHCTGNLRRFLLPLVAVHRYRGEEVDQSLAQSEARILHDSIRANDSGYEEIVMILATRSRAQLNATFNCFKDEFGVSMSKCLLSSNLPEDLVSPMRIAVRCMVSPLKYFEKVLRKALNKPEVDRDALTRVVVTRAEKDLKLIKDLYQARANFSLEHKVAKETSGDYKNFLLALMGN